MTGKSSYKCAIFKNTIRAANITELLKQETRNVG